MMKNNEGSASGRLLALILAGALVLTAGVTAFADEGNESSDMKSDNVEIIETDAQFAEEDLIALDGELPPPDAEIEPQPEDVYDDGTEGLAEELPVQEEETPEIDVVEPSEETTSPEDGEPGDKETNQVESTDADEIDIVENPLYGDQDPPLPPEIETPEPPEPVLLDEEAIDTFFEECLRIAAPEIAAMDEEQLAMLEEAWMNNIFVYDPGDDILNAYMIEGIGDYTRLVIAIENVRACIDFVQENYQGDEEFIRAFHEAVVTGYSDIVRLGTYDLLSEETKVSLFDAVFHCFSAVREIEDAEVESFGETLIMKLGKGVPVSAEDNPQLKIYGLGVLQMAELLYDPEVVRLTIFQPRLNNSSTWDISPEDLKRWGEEVLRPRAAMALMGAGEFAAGSWCRFCKARNQCRARAEEFLQLAKMEFRQPALLDDAEIAEIITKADELAKWAADIYAFAQDEAIIHGKQWPGFKVVEGRSARKYSSEEEVAAAAEAAGYKDIYKKALIGIGDMERLMGKAEFQRILGAYVYKPAGKLTLVPDSDKREAVNKATASAEFQEV